MALTLKFLFHQPARRDPWLLTAIPQRINPAQLPIHPAWRDEYPAHSARFRSRWEGEPSAILLRALTLPADSRPAGHSTRVESRRRSVQTTSYESNNARSTRVQDLPSRQLHGD